jgi:hypothetical protein
MSVVMKAIPTNRVHKSFVTYIGVYGVQYSEFLSLEQQEYKYSVSAETLQLGAAATLHTCIL